MKHEAFALVGPPNGGKGTAADAITERCPSLFNYIATGDLIRHAMKQDTPMGRRLKECIPKGGFAEDDDVLELFMQRLDLDERINRYIPGTHILLLDGVLRTEYEAIKLETHLNIRTIYLFDKIPKSKSYRRMQERVETAIAEGELPRPEDTPAALERRLLEYEQITLPMMKYYKRKNVKICRIDASQSKEKVAAEILVHMKGLLRSEMQATTRKYTNS